LAELELELELELLQPTRASDAVASSAPMATPAFDLNIPASSSHGVVR
jgi:hypothetical protein